MKDTTSNKQYIGKIFLSIIIFIISLQLGYIIGYKVYHETHLTGYEKAQRSLEGTVIEDM